MKPFTKFPTYSWRHKVIKVSTLRQIAIATVFIFLSCASIEILRAGQQAGGATSSAPAAHGVDLSILDKTCKPCEDFYRFASGAWLAQQPRTRGVPGLGTF